MIIEICHNSPHSPNTLSLSFAPSVESSPLASSDYVIVLKTNNVIKKKSFTCLISYFLTN